MTDPASPPRAPLDFAFLDIQTHGDAALADEVLALFVEQARRLVPRLPDLGYAEQSATAHLLKGSCQGIGAFAAANLLHHYDGADAAGRRIVQPQLASAFAEIGAAIDAHLAVT